MNAQFDSLGQRLTDCCGTYSTFMDDGTGMDMVLCCKGCYEPVPSGQGDGTEFHPSTSEKEYWAAIRAGAEPRIPSQDPPAVRHVTGLIWMGRDGTPRGYPTH